MKRKERGPLNPGTATISFIACNILSLLTQKKRGTIQSEFSRAKKKLSDISDVVEYIRKYYEKQKYM